MNSPSPYDDYPYPDPNRYPPDQVKNLRIDSAPRRETWEQWFPGEEPAPKRVLVVGCGVYEAIAVAAQEPLLEVTGLDSSEKVIEIARNIAEKGGVGNVSFVCTDIMNDPPLEGARFDIVCASGVMHHIPDANSFVHRVRSMLKRGGLLSVMVYGDRYREFIPPFCQVLRTLRIKRDAHGIAFVRGLIGSLPPHHPVKAFHALATDYDAQIADIWLHPYFRQYSANELLNLMADHGMEFRRWIEPLVVDFSLMENAPNEFADIRARFEQLPYPRKCRIGQVLSHADIKLAAVFAR
jgi:SAM-dependent methyltransferase